MLVTGIKTQKVTAGSIGLIDFLDQNIIKLEDKSIVAITSKVVAICEGRVVPIGKAEMKDLVAQESDYYLDLTLSKYGLSFTVTSGTLVPAAGIDESNGNGNYILWPANPQESANRVREHLAAKFGLQVGVVITDSTARPLHYGTEGVCIAFSGFMPLNDYIGKPDLFGRPFKVSMANVPDGLASSAVLVMGEGTEQTPIAVIEDVSFVSFTDRNPSEAEIKSFYLKHMEDDLFAPFLKNAPWQKGGRQKH